MAHTHTEDDGSWASWFGQMLSGSYFHKAIVSASGALGGSLGPLSAAGDIAFSTAMIIRSIQEIAIDYGEDLSKPQALADCLSVLAMGGPRSDEETLDSTFLETRLGLRAGITEKSVSKAIEKGAKLEATQKVLASKVVQDALESTTFKKLIDRFGITTQAVFVEKSIPVVGAVFGAATNYQFMSYYQSLAHVLYRIKELESRYDPEQVNSCYSRVRQALKKDSKHFD